MGETLILSFHRNEDATFELRVKESWSGRTVSSRFLPPYTTRQANTLQKKLNNLACSDHELREIGRRLFAALCGTEVLSKRPPENENSVQGVFYRVIQRTLRRRGTVALIFSFGDGCAEFVRYPWELLHDGEHFLLVSGIFTLTRALLDSEMPAGCELPVHPPFRMLYIGASPLDCAPLETERSFASLERALFPLIESGQLFLDRLEPPTFDQLVRYLSSYGGAGLLDDSDTVIPCYVIHFDGHGAYGRLCPEDDCETVNGAEARKCHACGSSLSKVRPQTYLCLCDDEGYNRFIGTETLRDLFISSDVRLAVFSACETATVSIEDARQQLRRTTIDSTLATALVMAQVPAVVAMPFSLQDDLSPTFMYHFYEALADRRMLEEALARARHALLPTQQKSWFIPVLYRRVVEGEEGPVSLLVEGDRNGENDHPLAHMEVSTTFIGRTAELRDLDELLTLAAAGEQRHATRGKLRRGVHHFALTGSAGIGKSALAFEAVRRNRAKFPGGIIGISLQGGKSYREALGEMMEYLHLRRSGSVDEQKQQERLVTSTLRALASRELPCLLLLDGFEEIKDQGELSSWLRFLGTLPLEIIIIVTSRSNPENLVGVEGVHCRWYEYRVGKMTNDDLLTLFIELAGASGLDQRIHLDDPRQQEILREICTLLDGYPLGAELIFGTTRTIEGRIYRPEAATRSLAEVRDELRSTPLAGIMAVLEVSYSHLSRPAQRLLSYLSVFKLPFNNEQILTLFPPTRQVGEIAMLLLGGEGEIAAREVRDVVVALAQNWRGARAELVQASFILFDGQVYSIHPQVRHFALSHLSREERCRIYRVIADHYYAVSGAGTDEWLAAREMYEQALVLSREVGTKSQTLQLVQRLGELARHLQQYEQAVCYYSEALANTDQSDSYELLYRRGEMYQFLGKYRQALEDWMQASQFEAPQGMNGLSALQANIKELIIQRQLEELYAELYQKWHGVQKA